MGGRTRLDDGRLVVYRAPRVHARQLPMLVARALVGRRQAGDFAILSAGELWIDAGGARRLRVAVDGEVVSMRAPLHYRTRPKALAGRGAAVHRPMRTIVHLSDIHFGRVDPRLVAPLVDAVRAAAPDLVAVSGDLTQRARRRQFEQARAFLDKLPPPILAVPGNHDVPLFNLPARFLDPFGGYRRHIAAGSGTDLSG